MALPIEDYALIGDRHTAALVGRNGSIDWLCLPRFDSPACFAGLLGDDGHGHWQLEPTSGYQVARRYVDDSAALETTFTTDQGTVVLLDVMPTGDHRADVVRRVTGVRGSVRLRHEWVVRMDYGAIAPWVRRRQIHGEEVITAVAGPDKLVLRGPRLPIAHGHRHVDEFAVEAGDELTFSMTWIPSYERTPESAELPVAESIAADAAWAAQCHDDVPHVDVVRRSLLTLRLMTHEQTGGIVAAPTTSLPEDFGGERNWDYRYCWLRDAALTIESLIDAGYTDEARFWRHWLLRSVAGDPDDLQIMYTVDGARHLPEHTLDHLPGYSGSRPVRIGNSAVEQRQSDVLGELMIALSAARSAGLEDDDDDDAWNLQRSLVDRLAQTWQEPDHGIWEIRGPRRRFTHSQVMVWAAFDRAVRAVEDEGLEGPVDRWREAREAVCQEILSRGFDERRNTFTQHDETLEVDASLLVLPLVGFVKGDDPRMLGTIEAIEQDLMRDGLLMRYRTRTGVDGLDGGEHPFLACSFWLVSAYAAAGRLEDAHALFDRLVALVNDVGLLSEEYDVRRRRMVGNFPQAFSHLTLVQAAFRLRAATGIVR